MKEERKRRKDSRGEDDRERGDEASVEGLRGNKEKGREKERKSQKERMREIKGLFERGDKKGGQKKVNERWHKV